MDIVASTVIIVINIKGVEAIDSCCRLARLSLQNSCLIAHSEPIWNASVAISNLWLEMQNAQRLLANLIGVGCTKKCYTNISAGQVSVKIQHAHSHAS